ncbi:hypothetical protein B7486_51375, partial [cyanobacterium TDX16]
PRVNKLSLVDGGSQLIMGNQPDLILVDLKQQERNLSKQIQSIQSQLSITSKELQEQQNVSVLAPTTGVVWSIDSQTEEIVEANKSIIQLLNCQNL